MLSKLYALVAARRRRWYEQHQNSRRRLVRPVISVGGISVGGSGKTPVAKFIAELLRDAGEYPAILSRGYGRAERSEGVVVVRERNRVLADFVVAGTMYTTRSHPGSTPAGPGLIENMVRNCRLPIIGIGGITPDNLAPVIRAGASGVAVISNVLGAQEPRRAAEELKQALQEATTTMGTLGPSEQPTGGNGSA